MTTFKKKWTLVAKISSMLFKILTKFRQNYDKNMGVSADIIQVTFTIPTGETAQQISPRGKK